MTINRLGELEDFLSRPSQADVDAMAALEGDLLLLGVGGKMGPSLARRAVRAIAAAGVRSRVIGVARFTDASVERQLRDAGVETVTADLLARGTLARLPDAANVIFMAAKKFGTTGDESSTWAMNTFLPGLVAERYHDSRIVAFSSGNVYPFSPVLQGGPAETSPTGPVGEYAQSVLGRERILEYHSRLNGTPVALLRLNYAVELRYGVILDVGQKVAAGQEIDLRMGHVNVIWQGDANSVCLRSFSHCQSPPAVINLTGPETVPIRWIAKRFGDYFGVAPVFVNEEADHALLNNAARCHAQFGYPSVTLDQIIEWVAHWICIEGPTSSKPTHFEVLDGKF